MSYFPKIQKNCNKFRNIKHKHLFFKFELRSVCIFELNKKLREMTEPCP